MPKIDEETECYYVRGLTCCNLIPDDAMKELLSDPEAEISARPTDFDTCICCLLGLVVESLQTIIGNIPDLIPLVQLRVKPKEALQSP